MKIYFCTLLILTGSVLNITAQGRQDIKIEASSLFSQVGSIVMGGIKLRPLEEYGMKIERTLADRPNPEREAAILLIELQGKNPQMVILNQKISPHKKSPKEKVLLQADKLIFEYLKALLFYCEREGGDALPLEELFEELKFKVDRGLLNREVEMQMGPKPSEKQFAYLIVETKKALEKEGIGNIRDILLESGKGPRLPFPICYMFGNC